MRSTGWSSGVWGGNANKVILLGATSPWLLCQLAPSRITTAWASAATWLLISLRWWFMAAGLQIGMISAAALPSDGQTAPKQIGRSETEILRRHWPAAGLPPHPGQAVLLADASLVLKPYLDSRTRRLRRPDSL